MSENTPDSQLIAEFVSITNSSTYLAEQYLLRNNNDLVEAVEDFYANNEPSQKSETKNLLLLLMLKALVLEHLET